MYAQLEVHEHARRQQVPIRLVNVVGQCVVEPLLQNELEPLYRFLGDTKQDQLVVQERPITKNDSGFQKECILPVSPDVHDAPPDQAVEELCQQEVDRFPVDHEVAPCHVAYLTKYIIRGGEAYQEVVEAAQEGYDQDHPE